MRSSVTVGLVYSAVATLVATCWASGLAGCSLNSSPTRPLLNEGGVGGADVGGSGGGGQGGSGGIGTGGSGMGGVAPDASTGGGAAPDAGHDARVPMDAATGGSGGSLAGDAGIATDASQADGSTQDAGNEHERDSGTSGSPTSRVRCGPLECDLEANQMCCLANLPGYPTEPADEDFSCISTPSPGASCDLTLSCDQHGDCGDAELCCARENGDAWELKCRKSCSPPMDIELACNDAADCGDGEVCCGTLTSTGLRYQLVQCSDECSGDDDRILCASDAECEGDATCRRSTLWGALDTCRGPGQ